MLLNTVARQGYQHYLIFTGLIEYVRRPFVIDIIYERLTLNYLQATITRCSQPMVGIKQARSIQDEKLIEAIFASNAPNGLNGQIVYGSTAANLIIDARPMANAVGNVARGAGTENMENYRNCKKNYMGIDNIHVMRDSLARMCDGKLSLSEPWFADD